MACIENICCFSMSYKDGEFTTSIEKLLVSADSISNEILNQQVTIVSACHPFEVMAYSTDSNREKTLRCLEKAIDNLMLQRKEVSTFGIVPGTILH